MYKGAHCAHADAARNLAREIVKLHTAAIVKDHPK
jgi:hypothetical protein